MNVMLVSEYECNISVDYDDIQFLILQGTYSTILYYYYSNKNKINTPIKVSH